MGTIDNISKAVGGGWVSVAVIIGIMILMGWLKARQAKARRDAAKKETNETRIDDQADTSDINQNTEDRRDEANSEIDDVRERMASTPKKKRPRS